MLRPISPSAVREIDPTIGPDLELGNALGWGDPLRGAFVLVPTADRECEGHVYVRPEARGREAVRAGRELVRVVNGAGITLVARPPRRENRIFAALCGLHVEGDRWVSTP